MRSAWEEENMSSGCLNGQQGLGRKSLLAIGIQGVRGNFRAGEVVEILSQDGKQITKGRVNYSAAKIRKIMGLKSSQIKEVLGEAGQAEVIHADNLAL